MLERSERHQRILALIATKQEYGNRLRAKTDVILTGVGPIEAAASTALCLQNLVASGKAPEYVISLGSAASLTKPVGSLWQVSGVSWRDMDASKMGFEKGVTPFEDHPAVVPLHVTSAKIPTATLSTGADVVGPDDLRSITAELVDMETFAIARACKRFSIPLIGLRGVSDGPELPEGLTSWEDKLALVDQTLAEGYDKVVDALFTR